MLTDAQIAILCDIGQASSFDDEKRNKVLIWWLVATSKGTATFLRLRPGVRKCCPIGAQGSMNHRSTRVPQPRVD